MNHVYRFLYIRFWENINIICLPCSGILWRDIERRVFLVTKVTKIEVPSVEGNVSSPVLCNYLRCTQKAFVLFLLFLCTLYFVGLITNVHTIQLTERYTWQSSPRPKTIIAEVIFYGIAHAETSVTTRGLMMKASCQQQLQHEIRKKVITIRSILKWLKYTSVQCRCEKL
jgi:hypothetical protein